MPEDVSGFPHKIAVSIAKYHDGDTTHAPDETVVREQWFDGHGEPISDPSIIAFLDAAQAAGEQ